MGSRPIDNSTSKQGAGRCQQAYLMDDGSLWDYLSTPVRDCVQDWLGASMNSAKIVFPAKFANACADIVGFAHFGGKAPSGLALIQDWLEGAGWEQLARWFSR